MQVLGACEKKVNTVCSSFIPQWSWRNSSPQIKINNNNTKKWWKQSMYDYLVCSMRNCKSSLCHLHLAKVTPSWAFSGRLSFWHLTLKLLLVAWQVLCSCSWISQVWWLCRFPWESLCTWTALLGFVTAGEKKKSA